MKKYFISAAGEESIPYKETIEQTLPKQYFQKTNDQSKAQIIFRFLSAEVPIQPNPKIELISKLWGTDKDQLGDKSKLKAYLDDAPYLPPTEHLHRDIVLASKPSARIYKHPMILKPVGSLQGIGNTRVKSPMDIYTWVNSHKNFESWVLQKYIVPATVDSYKFHIRVWVLATKIKNEFHIYAPKLMRIYTAKKPYQHDNFADNDIHDTHSSDEDKVLWFPNKKPDGWTDKDIALTHKRLRSMIEHIFQNAQSLKPEAKAQNGYHIFGLDVLFDQKTKKPYLLEVNKKIGHNPSQVILYPSILQHTVGELYGIDLLNGLDDYFYKVF